MADFQFERKPDPVEAPPPERPHIVDLPTTYDMAEDFLSEADSVEPPAAVEEPNPASVIAFPAHPIETPEPVIAAPSEPALAPAQSYTLVDLLEKQGGLEWRECIALVHQLCLQLKGQSSPSPIVIDPRNIQITDNGEVRLLPSPTGGDPLVMQVGRLLRTMLMGRPAPPELRLLMAQATFELPIFESIDEVDRALQQMERLDDHRIGAAAATPSYSALATKFTSILDGAREKPAPTRPIRPVSSRPRRAAPTRLPTIGSLLSTYSARIVAALVIVGSVGLLFIARPTLLLTGGKPPRQSAPPPTTTSPLTATTPLPIAPAAPASEPLAGNLQATTGTGPAARPPRQTIDRALGGVERGRERPRLPATPSAASAPTNAAPPVAIPPPRESERRASALVALGQTAEAAQVFNAMLAANPLYEPKPSDLTPESLSAFRATQKQMLPLLAQRGYERARAAFAEGDIDRALAVGKETAAILERPAAEPAASLRQPVQQLVDEALLAKANADEIIYTRGDAGVVPPRPLSRQFPATTPSGVPPHRVGTLEMVIGKEGTVEFVKLHTPLNRYHERMIVSAAKAWLYRPATRGGKPVRFRITVTINLPENGTY